MSVFKIKEGYESIHELFGGNKEKKELQDKYNSLRRKEQEVLSQIKSAQSHNDKGAEERLTGERERILNQLEEISKKIKEAK